MAAAEEPPPSAGGAGPAASSNPAVPSLEDQTLLVFARLMEGGQEDEDTCRELDNLTRLLNEDALARTKDASRPTICQVIDGDCVDTVLCYLDMRQTDVVRGHATLATSAYLKAAGEDGSRKLSAFFFDRVRRGTYDDYIVAFCVASATFPIAQELTTELFLSEGFLGNLGPLMRREWKSRKVETACLEMLSAACSITPCREAVQKYCVEWLEEVVDQDTTGTGISSGAEPKVQGEDGSISMRRHSEQVQHLAAVILAKLRAIPSGLAASGTQTSRVEPASTGIEDLSRLFASTILRDQNDDKHHSVEGLAYASLQPRVKEAISVDEPLLRKLVQTLNGASPKSPTTYGVLSIFMNLTRYRPAMSEEAKKISQLKAYAAAAGKLAEPDPLDDDEHVSKRCLAVFHAGLVPVLVSHSKNGSPASLGIIVSIILSLSVTASLRGQLSQQGAVKLLLLAWANLHELETSSRRAAAQALARILISINPALVFGGNRSNPVDAAVRPLSSLLTPDPASDSKDLLPTFEALMALTNLASLQNDEVRKIVICAAWSQVEEQMLSSNTFVSKAAVELVCNLVQAPEGVALYADGSHQASNRLHILLALADAEDEGTRSGAGGALASLTGFEGVVRGVVRRKRGVKVVLDMCNDDSEDIRHRGVVTIWNMVMTVGEAGELARRTVTEEGGLEVLKDCLKQSRRPEVIQIAVEALKRLMG